METIPKLSTSLLVIEMIFAFIFSSLFTLHDGLVVNMYDYQLRSGGVSIAVRADIFCF